MKKTAHSKNFDKVKKYYDEGFWTKAMVRNAVTHPTNKPWITEAEYQTITGEEYADEDV